MNSSLLKLAVLGALGVASAPVFAAGSLQPLVVAPTGSAYINCYNDGRVVPPLAGPQETTLNARSNFGTTALGGSSGVCEITGLANDLTAPLPGYGLQVTSTTQSILNPAGTTIGSVVERIWRKPAATAPVTPTNMCIIGTKVALTNNATYDSTSGYFELNDIARGGYSNSGTVNVGYFALSSTPSLSPVYRAGRTFTSVQHRAYRYAGTIPEQQNNGTGYLDLPSTGTFTGAINGVNSGISGSTIATATAAQQEAAVNSNWVDFTIDAVFADDDGTTNPTSAMTYVEFPCNADSAAVMNSVVASGSTLGWRKAGALRLRRTAQELTTFAEISLTGYAPPGAVIP